MSSMASPELDVSQHPALRNAISFDKSTRAASSCLPFSAILQFPGLFRSVSLLLETSSSLVKLRVVPALQTFCLQVICFAFVVLLPSEGLIASDRLSTRGSDALCLGKAGSEAQPHATNYSQFRAKKLLASNFSKLASQKQMYCGATSPAPPAFLGTPSHPASALVSRTSPGWRGVEGALNSACPTGFEHTYLPLCLLPAALWLQLHRCVCCTPLSGCEWSQRPLCRGEGNLSLHLVSLMASVVETGPSRPKLGTGNASPGLSAARWEPSPCAGQGDATAVGAQGEGEGRRLPEAPAVGK